MGILTDLFLHIQLHILKPALGLQLPGGKIDKCSPICLSVYPSGRPSYLVGNIGGGGEGGGGQGGQGGGGARGAISSLAVN